MRFIVRFEILLGVILFYSISRHFFRSSCSFAFHHWNITRAETRYQIFASDRSHFMLCSSWVDSKYQIFFCLLNLILHHGAILFSPTNGFRFYPKYLFPQEVVCGSSPFDSLFTLMELVLPLQPLVPVYRHRGCRIGDRAMLLPVCLNCNSRILRR